MPPMTDTRALRNAVESGAFDEHLSYLVLPDFTMAAAMPFVGGIEGAQSLVEGLLPGWDWTMHSNGQAALWPPGSVEQQNAGVIEFDIEGNPARALLVCVLKAMEAGDVNYAL